MTRYDIEVNFKNSSPVKFSLETDIDLKLELAKEWAFPKGVLYIGDYSFNASEILWIKVEGEKIEKHSWTEISSNTGTKIV